MAPNMKPRNPQILSVQYAMPSTFYKEILAPWQSAWSFVDQYELEPIPYSLYCSCSKPCRERLRKRGSQLYLLWYRGNFEHTEWCRIFGYDIASSIWSITCMFTKWVKSQEWHMGHLCFLEQLISCYAMNSTSYHHVFTAHFQKEYTACHDLSITPPLTQL